MKEKEIDLILLSHLELQGYAHLTLMCVKCMGIILVLFLVIVISLLAIVG